MANEEELKGLETIKRMGLRAYGNLGQVEIVKVFPNNKLHAPGEHFEFDYLILYEDICIVGETTTRARDKNIKSKYKRFRDQFELLSSAAKTDMFKFFNIPQEDLYFFEQVRSYKAFFVAQSYEKYDIEMSEYPGIPVIYYSDWETIEAYANTLGKYAVNPFLALIGIPPSLKRSEDIVFTEKDNRLMYESNCIIAKDADIRADVFTFITRPSKLLQVSEVFRRQLMPIVSSKDEQYQRPLDFEKLKEMRDLVSRRGFMFPNNILVALDDTCKYKEQENELCIPKIYGAISVIDGQHRLFSYASRAISDEVREGSSILVTALRFRTQSKEEIIRCSAITFIEINTKQKKIPSDHIDEIAYSVLGQTHPKALAAQVILRANQRQGKLVSGLFGSSQSTGYFKAATVISQLYSITNKTTVANLLDAKTKLQNNHRRGYENLFGVPSIDQLQAPEEMIQNGVVCLERYCNCIKKSFGQDWTDEKISERSTLGYTKVFAAFIKLLNQFIRDGLTWNQVEQELKQIRKYVLEMQHKDESYIGVVFPKGSPEIPDDKSSIPSIYRFLDENRHQPKSLLEATTYTLDDIRQTLSEGTREVFDALRDRILQLDTLVEEDINKLFTSYRTTKEFVSIEPGKRAVKLILNLEPEEVEGSYQNIRDMRYVSHRGVGNVGLKISSPEEVEGIMPLIQQSITKNT